MDKSMSKIVRWVIGVLSVALLFAAVPAVAATDCPSGTLGYYYSDAPGASSNNDGSLNNPVTSYDEAAAKAAYGGGCIYYLDEAGEEYSVIPPHG